MESKEKIEGVREAGEGEVREAQEKRKMCEGDEKG